MNNIKYIFTTFITILFLISSNTFAAHQGKNESHNNVSNKSFSIKDVKLNPNEAVVEVHGVVCSFCSYGIQKKLSKLDFIDTSKYNNKGSEINIENQTATIAIKPNNKVDMDIVFEAIKSGGYEPVKAYTADGKGTVTQYFPKDD